MTRSRRFNRHNECMYKNVMDSRAVKTIGWPTIQTLFAACGIVLLCSSISLLNGSNSLPGR